MEQLHLGRAEFLDIRWKMGRICKVIALEMEKLSSASGILVPTAR